MFAGVTEDTDYKFKFLEKIWDYVRPLNNVKK